MRSLLLRLMTALKTQEDNNREKKKNSGKSIIKIEEWMIKFDLFGT